jgi:hypothetical protein
MAASLRDTSAIAARSGQLECSECGIVKKSRRLFLDLPQRFEDAAHPGLTYIEVNPLSVRHGYMLRNGGVTIWEILASTGGRTNDHKEATWRLRIAPFGSFVFASVSSHGTVAFGGK